MPLVLKPRVLRGPPRVRPPRRKPKPPRPDHCLNCGRAADGNFCAFCGQENKDHTVALRPLLSDLLAEIVSWDSKLLRTLAALVRRPGFLTNEYNAGRRVPYVSPLKVYLAVSVLFFLILPWEAGKVNLITFTHRDPSAHSVGIAPGDSGVPMPSTAATYDAQQKNLPPDKRDSAFERLLSRRAIRAGGRPAAFAQSLLGDIPKMMFFLLPLFAGTLKLLYLRTRRLYVEHLVFLLHVHAFAFLALTLLLLVHPDWLVVTVFLALAVYILAALRAVYRQGWPKTLTKFCLLGAGYLVLLSLCIAGTTFVALWLF